MSEPSSNPNTDDSQLDEVLAKYFERVDRGEAVDREQLVAEHPDVADGLREFFATSDAVENMARPVAPAGDLPINRDAVTLPPSSLVSGEPDPSDATPELSSSCPQPSTLNGQPSPTRLRYFGDYELLDEIARGGMGVVYKARQVSLNRIVAVKMILAGQLAGADDVRRFRTEAEAAAQLQHPNIVAIHEVGEHEGQQYFSMDYIEGTSLAALVRENPLPAKQAAAIVKTVAEAIHYAHLKGILHRDLKPSNILLQMDRTEGNKGNEGSPKSLPDRAPSLTSSRPSLPSFPSVQSLTPKISDFGLAKRIEGGSELTGTGQILGTPSYMPPEQAGAKRGEIGPASDVYSLGAILYELLTGRPPFRAETPLDTLLQVLDSEPVAPRLLNPKIDKDLETICLKCLQKEAPKRYGTAQAFADDLQRYANGEPIHARPVTLWQKMMKRAEREPVWAALNGVGVVGVLLLLLQNQSIREWLFLWVTPVVFERFRDAWLGTVLYGVITGAFWGTLAGGRKGGIRGFIFGEIAGAMLGVIVGLASCRSVALYNDYAARFVLKTTLWAMLASVPGIIVGALVANIKNTERVVRGEIREGIKRGARYGLVVASISAAAAGAAWSKFGPGSVVFASLILCCGVLGATLGWVISKHTQWNCHAGAVVGFLGSAIVTGCSWYSKFAPVIATASIFSGALAGTALGAMAGAMNRETKALAGRGLVIGSILGGVVGVISDLVLVVTQ